jgi:ubiquinone/menaquinone biosynthesis C-methylase UbiE
MPTRASSIASAALVVASALPLAAPQPGVHPISGRHIADVMSAEGADWLDRRERDGEEAPDQAVAALDLRRGQTVADVGAGSGYMTVRLSRRVGPAGLVYAVDIQPEMIARLTQRLTRDRLTNVKPVLGAVDDPRLPAESLDLALLVDVYHELQAPQQMLRQLRRALKPGGNLVLIEYRKEDPAIPIRLEHKMTVAEAKLELEAEGFRLWTVNERLPRQHLMIFRKAPDQ